MLTARDSEIMKAAGDLHGHVGQPWLLVPKAILDDPAALHPGDGVLYADSKLRQLVVDVFLGGR